MIKVVVIACVVVLVPFVVVLALSAGSPTFEVHLDMEQPVQDAVEVAGLENKFVVILGMSFGGAGAGGQGAPVVAVFSIDQFIELVPPGERIYVAIRRRAFDRYVSTRIVEREYWAFIENRAGLVSYKQTFKLGKRGCHYRRYFEDTLVFECSAFVASDGGTLIGPWED